MKRWPFVVVYSNKIFILVFSALLFVYVIVKHIGDRQPVSSPITSMDIKKDDMNDAKASKLFYHYDFHEFDACLVNLKKAVRRSYERIDTFRNTGTVVKIAMSTLYVDTSSSRLVSMDITYLKTRKDCRVSLYMDKENSVGPDSGCNGLRTRCLMEVTCETKSFLGGKMESRNYRLLSEGYIRMLN